MSVSPDAKKRIFGDRKFSQGPSSQELPLPLFVLSMWIWAPYLIPSLQNVLNPWSSRVLPHLNATIVPGDTHVAEGGDLRVTATASQLTDAVLEVIENDAVIASHQMATEENGRTAEFTLTGLQRDRQYRVRAGGLYSDRFQIFVDPKPVIKSSHVNLTFPEYTQLPPQVINDPAEPIEVIHGTRIRIDVDSHVTCCRIIPDPQWNIESLQGGCRYRGNRAVATFLGVHGNSRRIATRLHHAGE